MYDCMVRSILMYATNSGVGKNIGSWKPGSSIDQVDLRSDMVYPRLRSHGGDKLE